MLNKKAQVNKVFVFVFSVIIILFAAFLVVKFVSTFLDDSTKVYEQKFFEQIEQNYDSVLKTYGSEKVYKYRVSSRIEYICFVSNTECIDSLNEINDTIYPNGKDNMKIVSQNGDNVMIFDKDGIYESKNIGEFIIRDTGCFCENPSSAQYFSLLMENSRNKVYFDKITEFE